MDNVPHDRGLVLHFRRVITPLSPCFAVFAVHGLPPEHLCDNDVNAGEHEQPRERTRANTSERERTRANAGELAKFNLKLRLSMGYQNARNSIGK